MMRFFTRLRNQRVNRLLNPSSKTEQKDQPVLKLFNANIAENAAGGILTAGVLSLLSYLTGAGRRDERIERLEAKLVLSRQKESATEERLERTEQELGLEKQKSERTEQKLERTEQKLDRVEASNQALAMLLRNTNQRLFISLLGQQACQSAFQNSYCFYRQRYTLPEQGSKITNEYSHTQAPGGPTC